MNNVYGENPVNGDSNGSSGHLDNNFADNKIKESSNDEDIKKNSSFAYEYNSKLTGSYFCFECGAIMTTKEDKSQHDLFESHEKSKFDEINYEH